MGQKCALFPNNNTLPTLYKIYLLYANFLWSFEENKTLHLLPQTWVEPKDLAIFLIFTEIIYCKTRKKKQKKKNEKNSLNIQKSKLTSDLRDIATFIQANDETEARSLHTWWLVNIRYNKYFSVFAWWGKFCIWCKPKESISDNNQSYVYMLPSNKSM